MNNNNLIIILLLVILIVVTIVYLRQTESIENFQENIENGLSKVNIENSKNIIYQKDMDNDILYLNVRVAEDINGGNGQFYLFNKPNENKYFKHKFKKFTFFFL